MAKRPARIDFSLPAVPHSLRAFIEKVARDERTLMMFVESPVTTLQAAGVPIREAHFTKSDYDRLILVAARLHDLVVTGKVAQDFRFEDVFPIGADVAYQRKETETDSFANKNFENDKSHSKTSRTEEGIKTQFKPYGVDRPTDLIVAPLLSPGDLAAITALMQERISSMFER